MLPVQNSKTLCENGVLSAQNSENYAADTGENPVSAPPTPPAPSPVKTSADETNPPLAPNAVSATVAAQRIGVSKSTLHKWIRAGYLPAFKGPGSKGSSVRIEVKELEAFLQKHRYRVDPASTPPTPE